MSEYENEDPIPMVQWTIFWEMSQQDCNNSDIGITYDYFLLRFHFITPISLGLGNSSISSEMVKKSLPVSNKFESSPANLLEYEVYNCNK